jgi:hypothetical protein
MPKLKRGTRTPSATEDAAITKAAKSDPDAVPYTDTEWKAAKVHVRVKGAKVNSTKAGRRA